MNIEIKPITHEDYVKFYNKQPERTIQGYSILLNGELVAVFGVLMEKKNVRIMFSDMKKDINVPKMTIWRWSKKAMAMLNDIKLPIYAYTDNSEKYLQSLGFCYHADTKYGKLYRYVR